MAKIDDDIKRTVRVRLHWSLSLDDYQTLEVPREVEDSDSAVEAWVREEVESRLAYEPPDQILFETECDDWAVERIKKEVLQCEGQTILFNDDFTAVS